MISIEEHCQKFETKVLKEQEKKGKNSKTKEHFDETVKRLKMLEKKMFVNREIFLISILEEICSFKGSSKW